MVLHVLDLPRLAYPMLGADIAQDLAMSIEQAMREEGQQILKRTMAHLSYHASPVSKYIEVGTPAEEILSMAQAKHVDLIAIGARGIGQFRELILGSVSHRVLTHAPCPVLTITTPLQELKNILLPVHGPEDAEHARHFLMKRPFPSKVKITAFTVVPIPRSILRTGVSAPEAKIQQALESAELFIDRVVTELNMLPYTVTGMVGMGTPAETILEQAATIKSDLIIMGTHNRSAVNRFLMGSVSHTVLNQGTCSTLLIR
ncbi:MAG: hypothetical protein GKS05_00080 [Nitrospirales bacterium]|nr:hypothetical protein [Nitrospirales bacterium]